MNARLESVHPVLTSGNLSDSLRFFGRLGFQQVFVDNELSPRYAAVRRDGVELHLQWHDAMKRVSGQDRPVYRIVVSDVDGLHAVSELAR